MKTRSILPVVFAVAVLPAAQAAMSVYVSPDGIQTAEASGIMGVSSENIRTENFSSRPLGDFSGFTSPTTAATYAGTADSEILNSSFFGGFAGGNYLGVASGESVSITLAQPAQYFGFQFLAGDAFNQIEFYSGSTLVLSFTTATLLEMIPDTPGTTITAINGSQYLTANYYGQPETGNNANQPYAYLHFVATEGTSFNRIVMTQIPSNAIFESDNHSLLNATPILPDTLVVVPVVPEPGSMALAAVAAGGLAVRRRR